MNRVTIALLLGVLLVAAGSALAMDKPTLTMPVEGQALGPDYEIAGSMPHRALLVVMTDVIRTDTGEVLGSVPGIRHWTFDDNSFKFRCASPRVYIGEVDTPLAYRVRCYEMNAAGEKGPEAVVNCRMAP